MVNILSIPNLEDSLTTSPSSKKLSHLLQIKAIFDAEPNVLIYFANYCSYAVTGFLASITNRIRCDSWMALTVCLKISSFSWEPDDLLIRSASTPGVSITEASPSSILNYFLSLVVPRCLSTTATLSPIRQLKRLLFPQLGRPTSDTLNMLLSSAFLQPFLSSRLARFYPRLVIIFSICSGEWRISWACFALLVKDARVVLVSLWNL